MRVYFPPVARYHRGMRRPLLRVIALTSLTFHIPALAEQKDTSAREETLKATVSTPDESMDKSDEATPDAKISKPEATTEAETPAETQAPSEPAKPDDEDSPTNKTEVASESPTPSLSAEEAEPLSSSKAQAQSDSPAQGEVDTNERNSSDSQGPDSSHLPSPPHPRAGFIFAPRLGLAVGGGTHLALECEETGDLGCGTFGIRDHDESSGLAISADALYGIIPELRLGASMMWVPQVKGDAGGDLRKLGTGVTLQAVAEGVFDLVDRLAVTVRLQGGAAALAPAGFVDDVVEEAQKDCETARDAGIDCTVSDGPYIAPTLGGGAGLLIQTKNAARVRLDFLFQTHRMRLYEQNAASDAGTVSAVVSMDQAQFWILGGFEI